MNEILVSESKTLKLTNVLSRPHHAGGLCQYQPDRHPDGKLCPQPRRPAHRPRWCSTSASPRAPSPNPRCTCCARQTSSSPGWTRKYHMDAVLRVKNCLYAHYVGPMARNELATQKLNIYAFEHDIKLAAALTTIFVSQDDDEGVVDVFMEKE